jgi:LysR family transcriptional regulator, low CO2-responsive transcriptional regulator
MSVLLRTLTLRQLRALSAAAAEGSLTAAALRLGVTQPAISLQLRNLQQSAGMPLLQRTSEGMTPTEAGRALLTLDERVGRALRDCAETLETIRGATGGRVAIGAVSTAKYFVPAAIGAFARRHPGIDLKLSIGNRAQIMQGLRDFSLDGAITGRPPADLDLERRLIGDHPHVIVAPADHPLARAPRFALSSLAQDSFLFRESGSGTRLIMERFFEDRAFAPKIGMEIDSNETIKQAVMAGLGVAFISGHTVATEIADGRLAALDVEGLPVVRQWFVVYRRDRHLLPPAAALLDFLSSESAQWLPKSAPLRPAGRAAGAGRPLAAAPG